MIVSIRPLPMALGMVGKKNKVFFDAHLMHRIGASNYHFKGLYMVGNLANKNTKNCCGTPATAAKPLLSQQCAGRREGESTYSLHTRLLPPCTTSCTTQRCVLNVFADCG